MVAWHCGMWIPLPVSMRIVSFALVFHWELTSKYIGSLSGLPSSFIYCTHMGGTCRMFIVRNKSLTLPATECSQKTAAYMYGYLLKVNMLLSVSKEKEQRLFSLCVLKHRITSCCRAEIVCVQMLNFLKNVNNFLGSILIHHINISLLEVIIF